jgi:glycosyltransferase involved in cell wall biosynthesis
MSCPIVDKISVVTWKRTEGSAIEPFGSVEIIQVCDAYKPISVFRYFRVIQHSNSQVYIFNLMPTAYGTKNIPNLVGLFLPLYTEKILNRKTIVIYHNSTYTHDPSKLGYKGVLNRMRYFGLRLIERSIFNNVNTYFLTDTYAKILSSKLPAAKIYAIRLPFFQVMGTIFLNNLQNTKVLTITSGNDPRILLFGSWGPQKNLRYPLECLRRLKLEGRRIALTVAGGVNEHFPNLKEYYDRMFEEFTDVIDRRLQYVPEEKLIDLFTNTDLVVIPYNAPGGFSSVLGLSMFFERQVIISDFQEYREQASNYRKVIFYKDNELYDKIKDFVENLFLPNSSVDVEIKGKIDAMVKEFSLLLENLNQSLQG